VISDRHVKALRVTGIQFEEDLSFHAGKSGTYMTEKAGAGYFGGQDKTGAKRIQTAQTNKV